MNDYGDSILTDIIVIGVMGTIIFVAIVVFVAVIWEDIRRKLDRIERKLDGKDDEKEGK